ncbi:hypothetical protein STRIC_0436 [Streptococcus ictaluri 707-05]|uniref:Uncharacterized protein n=1 Tax=Streptococcus ictaluri 707-05 TaxID=764299 RepID=G5K5U9_9STRE|nr:hypothetical protein STRIC_0436 [Streptococcus ictaluri 707-05]
MLVYILIGLAIFSLIKIILFIFFYQKFLRKQEKKSKEEQEKEPEAIIEKSDKTFPF